MPERVKDIEDAHVLGLLDRLGGEAWIEQLGERSHFHFNVLRAKVRQMKRRGILEGAASDRLVRRRQPPLDGDSTISFKAGGDK